MIKKFKNDFLIYGLKPKDISNPFHIGNFTIYPKYDLSAHLKNYPPDKVRWAIEREAKYAYFQTNINTGNQPSFLELPDLHFAQTKLFLAAFRLFKAGWIQVDSIVPNIRAYGIEIMPDIDEPPMEQCWADPVVYELSRSEIPYIRRIYNDLHRIDLNYLDIALKHFNRSYDYFIKDQLDDCFADLVIALESLTSRGGDGILQSMVLRISLLLCSKYKERKGLEHDLKKFYAHRSNILHGSKADEKKKRERLEIIEDLRALVRHVIISCIKVLTSIQSTGAMQETMAENIDIYLYNQLQPK